MKACILKKFAVVCMVAGLAVVTWAAEGQGGCCPKKQECPKQEQKQCDGEKKAECNKGEAKQGECPKAEKQCPKQ